MSEWIDYSDCWELDGYGKYPVLGRPGEFCYFKYGEDENENIQDLVDAHCGEILEKGTHARYYHLLEDDDEKFYFVKVQCAISLKWYFLVTEHTEHNYQEEPYFFMIPYHPFNLTIFRKKYTNAGLD